MTPCVIIKEINPEYSGEGLMLKLQLQYLGHLMQEPTHWKRPCCWERLRAGGEGGDGGWDGWMASPTQWTWIWANSGRSERTGQPGVLQSMGLQSQTQLSDWTTTCMIMGKACLNQREGRVSRLPARGTMGRMGRGTERIYLNCPKDAGPDFCLISALGYRIWANCDGFLGLSGLDRGFSSMGFMDGLCRSVDSLTRWVCVYVHFLGERARAVYLYRLRFTKVVLSKAPGAWSAMLCWAIGNLAEGTFYTGWHQI